MATEAQTELLAWIRQRITHDVHAPAVRRKLQRALKELAGVRNRDKPDVAAVSKAVEPLRAVARDLSGLLSAVLDSRGAVAVTFGSTQPEIEAGLSWCDTACQLRPPGTQRRAWRRMLDL